MLFLNKTLRQNILILTVVFCFLALSFAATVESAQTKTGVKPTPTPTKKKATPTPAKTVKTSAKSTPKPTPKSTPKTNSTVKPTPKPSPTKTPVKPSATPTVQPKINQQVIVTVAAARVRSQSGTNSAEIKRVKLGTLLKYAEKKNDWYKVQVPGSPKAVVGWMSNQVVNEYDAAKTEDIYTRIIEKNYKSEGMSFNDAGELYEFLTKAQTEIKNPKLALDAGFKRLLALRAALKLIPFDKQNQKVYKDFLALHKKDIVYSEPSGEWYVNSKLFWELQKTNANSPNAEEIAWAAAQNPLPGECEGYVNCYLNILRETDGEYLNLYPSGKYSEQALKHINDLLDPIVADLAEKKIYTGPTDVSDRAEFNRFLAELRTIVSKLPFAEAEKQKTIQKINQIAESFR